MSKEEKKKLITTIGSHNSAQLDQFIEGSEIEDEWQLVYAASHNGVILSLPAKEGGQMRLRVAARFKHDCPYLEIRADHMSPSKDGDSG